MVKKELLQEYARVVARIGARVQKGETVIIRPQLDQPEFVTMVVEECYKAGAKEVIVRWSHDPIGRLHYKYQTVANLGKVDMIALAQYKYMVKYLPTVIHIISEDPDAMKGISQMKIAKAQQRIYPKIKKYIDASEGKYKWTIAAVPGKAWAKKVFPKLSEEEAMDKLWEAILLTSRIEENKGVQNWEDHNSILVGKREKLINMRLKALHYKANNGTDFHVELDPNRKWGAGIETAVNKGEYNPNIPTEEVFTSPMMGKAEGKLVASLPLSYNGELIEDFSISFKDGKVSEVKARKNQKLLEQMVSMDEGAAMLGEVALVPFESPINESGILFYNTLFDENAVCHVALGMGFRELVPNSEGMTTEELKAIGLNDSMIHVDFMIGTRDLDIVGEDEKGNKIQIFKNGTWAI